MPRSPFEKRPGPGGVQKGSPATKKQGFRKRSEDAPIWDEVESNLMAAIIRCSTTRNASPTFGYTRDGTSLTIAIYHEGDRMVDYLSGNAEVAEYLAWLVRDYFGLGDEEAKYYGLGPRETA